MKSIFTFLGIGLLALSTTSCETEVILGDGFNGPTLNEVLLGKELWYVDLNRTRGTLDAPFMTKAFTLSFEYGTLFANNNLVGIGSAGAGLGLDVGVYNAVNNQLSINHDIDGLYDFQVIVRDLSRIELIDLHSGTRYYLQGYNRNNFDYDALFYNNVHYFLQEYVAWEKVYTSNVGAINDFDRENYLQFYPSLDGDVFLSSKDRNGLNVNNLFWDFSGTYNVSDVTPGSINKHLTLGYDFIGNDYFDLYIVNDNTIELFHVTSGTTYRFKGKGFIQMKNGDSQKSRLIDANRVLNK